jgi:drug/metabolite transporter (DMT)-like permease
LTETLILSLAVLLRILSNPLGNVFQKQLTTKGSHPLFINSFTYLIISLISISIAIRLNWNLLPVQFWFYALLTGLAGGAGNGFLIKALQKGELSVLGPINAYKSVIGILGGIIFLGEFPNFAGLAGITCIIAGSYFVLDTGEDKFSFALLKRKDIQFRIWAMILTAIEAVFIKKMIIFSDPAIAFCCWCWFGFVFSFFLLVYEKVAIKEAVRKFSIWELKRYTPLVLCIAVMQFTTNYTFSHMPVGYALSLFQLSVILSVLMGHHFFNEQNILKKLAGAIIMIAGSVILILMKGH